MSKKEFNPIEWKNKKPSLTPNTVKPYNVKKAKSYKSSLEGYGGFRGFVGFVGNSRVLPVLRELRAITYIFSRNLQFAPQSSH